jgi:hypothetical protein
MLGLRKQYSKTKASEEASTTTFSSDLLLSLISSSSPEGCYKN